MILPAYDEYIEVYGIKNNTKDLIYEKYWSEADMEKIKNIVNEINKELNIWKK